MAFTADRILILIGVICFVLAALGFGGLPVNWFAMGWAFVVSGALLAR